MRCPACTQRNSVAAKDCKFCGQKLKNKSISISGKTVKAVGAVVAVGLVVGLASAVGSAFIKPEVKLDSVAQRMAAGPKTAEDAQMMRVQLDGAVQKYLEQHGNLASPDLLTKLQSQLPSSAFEVLVFDLPNSIKLVEVDCVLEPVGYLVVPVKSSPNPKVSRLSGISIYDANRLITDPEPTLVLLGHTTGDGPRQLQLKAVALLPSGEISDRTDKIFPPIKGSGSAAFVGATTSIKVERQLISSSRDQKLFSGEIPFKDETFVTTLNWKNGRYQSNGNLGTGELSALYAVASSLVEPTEVDDYRQYLSADVRDAIKLYEEKPVLAPGNFKIGKSNKEPSRRRRKKDADSSGGNYLLVSDKRAFEVTLAKSGRWSVTNLKETTAPATIETVAVKKEEPAVTPPSEDAKVVVKSSMSEEPKEIASISGTTETAKPKSSETSSKSEKESKREKSKKESREKETASSSGSGKIVTETSRSVTMRSGPGRGYGGVMNISRGTTISILGTENDNWVKISANGKTGYVFRSYVKGGGKSGRSEKAEKPSTNIASKEKPSSSKRSEKKEKVASSSSSKNDKKSKYASQISSRKAHTVDSGSSGGETEEPVFVP